SINPVSMTNKVMKDLGVDKAELKNTIKTANVSRQKKNQPQVMLVFTPTNPAPGDELNVTAMPNFFLNTTNNLYFTWYLKNARCYDEMIDGEDYKDKFLPGDFEKCDLNHDEEVDIEDYKIKAMRIIASDDFNWDPDGNGRADTNVYDPPSYIDDQDSYDASSGGEDQKGKNAHCFIHDVESGDEYELADCNDSENCECGHLFPNAVDNDIIINGSKGISELTAAKDFNFGKREEGFWRTNPNSRDTSQAGQFDEATVAGLGRATFKFNYSAGDKIGVAIEGVSIEPTQEKDSSYKTMWAFSKNTCDELLDADGFGENDGGYSPTVTTTTTTQSQIGDPLAIPPIPDLTCTIVVKKTTYPFIIAGTQINDSGDVRTHVITETTVTCTDDSTGLPATPRSPLQAYTILRESSCPDDENVTILDYEYENDSSDTTADTTYTCNAFDLTNQDISRTNLKVKDLNKCLYENLLTPAEGGGSKEKMEVTIAYSPKNPTNDSSGLKNGSELSLSSFINNAQNLEYLNYEWQVSYASTSDSDTWTLLTKDELPEATQTVGLGVDNFSFKLNFETSASMPSIPKYLKVKLVVKDSLTGGDEREGRTDVIIPIYSTEKRIMVYPTVITDTPLSVDIDDSSSTKELCVQNIGGIITPDAVCNVSKNTLLGVKIDGPSDYDNFKWSLDGANLFCPNATDFKDCINADQTQTNINYFPVLKSIGDEFTVNLIAVKKDTGEKINLTRTFKIVTPSVEIIPKEFNNPADPAQYTCRAKLTESSTDPLTGNPVEVRSKIDFNALTGFEIVLTPKGSGIDLTNPDNRKEYKWVINGDVITEENVVEYGYGITDGALTLPAKDYGEAYQIDFSALYSQDIKVNKVLNKYWKVGYDDFYEKRLTHAIKITMADSALVKAKTNSQKILATISAGIPSYIVFLFRIVLSGFVILFLLKILTFLIPKTKTYHYDEF
ncbi:MAG: hypothetical protein WAV31_06460, partial [Candidatus Moraniibacteriota bacterium]